MSYAGTNDDGGDAYYLDEVGEDSHQGWLELDRVLTRLWESHSICLEVRYNGPVWVEEVDRGELIWWRSIGGRLRRKTSGVGNGGVTIPWAYCAARNRRSSFKT